MSKDFGPTSGYLDPANKSWEQATWLTGKPPLDKEFNLAGEIAQRLVAHQIELSSGFLFDRGYYGPQIFPTDTSGNYVREPGAFRNTTPAVPAVVANRFYFGPGQMVHVAGMLVTLRQATSEWMEIDLPAAPAGVGVKRWDFVFLEVWRALLSGDNTVTPTHRDGSFKIFYNGWVDSPTGQNFTDDVYDAGVGTETSKRVQIQWRLRVVSGVDLITYPDPLDETTVVFAQGPEAAPTANTFTNAAGIGDPGLWYSTGNTNTVDGYVFAVPICAVARRNTTAYDKDTNQNGALALAGPADSGRSDDARYDVILEKDIVDLRKGVSREFNHEMLLQKNYSWLMDGKLKTAWEDSQLGGGQRGTQFTNADEIGNTDTPGANLIGDFDGIQKQWSDAVSVTEHISTHALASRTVAGNPGFWAEGDEFQIVMPVASTGIVDDIISVFTSSGYEIEAFLAQDLNTQTVTIRLVDPFDADVPLLDRTGSTIYVRFSATFPGGQGLTRDPLTYKADIVTGASLTALNGGDNVVIDSAVPAGMTAFSADSSLFRPSRTATLIGEFPHTSYAITSRTTTTTYVPYFIEDVVGIYDAVADPGKTTNLLVSFNGDTGLITHAVVPATHRSMLVDFSSKDPLPNGTQVTIYYETAAQQTVDPTAAVYNVSTLRVHVLHAAQHLYTTSSGSANHSPAYPYVRPGQLVPASDPTFPGEHFFDYTQAITVTGFSTSTQAIQLPLTVPFAHTPFLRLGNPDVDVENRAFYASSLSTDFDDDFGAGTVPYRPAVFANLLQQDIPHKVLYPCIGMLIEDTAIGKRGTLVLMVFTRTANDSQNAMVITGGAGGDSCVAIYRMKGNPTVSTKKMQLGYPLVEV
jgi:hypothetical protein